MVKAVFLAWVGESSGTQPVPTAVDRASQAPDQGCPDPRGPFPAGPHAATGLSLAAGVRRWVGLGGRPGCGAAGPARPLAGAPQPGPSPALLQRQRPGALRPAGSQPRPPAQVPHVRPPLRPLRPPSGRRGPSCSPDTQGHGALAHPSFPGGSPGPAVPLVSPQNLRQAPSLRAPQPSPGRVCGRPARPTGRRCPARAPAPPVVVDGGWARPAPPGHSPPGCIRGHGRRLQAQTPRLRAGVARERREPVGTRGEG